MRLNWPACGSQVVTSSSMPSHYTTRGGGALWRDSRIMQTYSSGGKQANRDWWNQLQDWHQILQDRNSSIPKIHSTSSKVIFSLHIRSPTLRHSTSSRVTICMNILPVFCRIGIFVCTLAWLNKKTELYVTALRGYTTSLQDGDKEGQRDWEIRVKKSLQPQFVNLQSDESFLLWKGLRERFHGLVPEQLLTRWIKLHAGEQ